MRAITEAARGRWRDILEALGIPEKFLTRRNGPCPMCDGKDRWRFTDHDEAGMWWCNQCGTGDGLDLLQRFNGWDFKRAVNEVKKMLPNMPEARAVDPDVKLKIVRDNLNRYKAGVLRATESAQVKRYLESRALIPSPLLMAHSASEYWQDGTLTGTYPAMVGLVTSPDGKPLTYHRTFLLDGQKAPVPSPRKIMPAAGDTTGAAIRLWPVSESLGIAEGIETALACHQLFGIPTWSAISAGGLERFIPPAEITELMIFADRDASYTGQAAAYALAKRLVRDTQIRVRVSLPDDMGDFADQLIAKKNNGAA